MTFQLFSVLIIWRDPSPRPKTRVPDFYPTFVKKSTLYLTAVDPFSQALVQSQEAKVTVDPHLTRT